MTENEAIERIQTGICSEKSTARYCNDACMFGEEKCAYSMAIKALEEVQQYRAIGTPEECRKSLEICKAMVERNITPDDMENYMKFEDECIKQGFTLNSILKSREKQTAKKPKEYEDKYYACPVCGNPLLHKWEKYPDKLMDKSNGLPYCLGCGQKLDWSDEYRTLICR